VTLPARVLAIAGSDSGGGAGIQADIKTISALGGYAMSAITAVTVQDTLGVHAVHAVPPDIVAAQIARVLSDIGADAVKTGMLVSAACVEAVAGALAGFAGPPVVVDTVTLAKGGAALLDASGVAAMKALLFPMARLVTPNAPEAAMLTGTDVASTDDLVRAGEMLRGQGARAVLMKGGHITGDMVTDVLIDENGVQFFRTRRIISTATHGTGCTLASAIATGLGQGMALHAAVARAEDFVHEAIRTGLPFGRGAGPLNHLHTERKV
jgi:hydroxymethylpyrimidine/phosphomethylpyrimidine kinase